jgi:hypothetical protein
MSQQPPSNDRYGRGPGSAPAGVATKNSEPKQRVEESSRVVDRDVLIDHAATLVAASSGQIRLGDVLRGQRTVIVFEALTCWNGSMRCLFGGYYREAVTPVSWLSAGTRGRPGLGQRQGDRRGPRGWVGR